MTEETNENEYDLKKSAKEIGHLYPVLKSPDGKIIAGRSRLKADPNWPVEVRKDLDTPLKFALARLAENLHRRSLPAEEKTEDLTAIAEALLADGFEGDLVKEIASRIAMSVRWVQEFLPEKFKQMEMKREPVSKEPDTDELIKIALRKGDSYRKIIDQFGCGASKIKRLKAVIEAEGLDSWKIQPELKPPDDIPHVTTPMIVRDEDLEPMGAGATITEEVMKEKPFDPLEGVTAKEVAVMFGLHESLKNFKQNYDELPIEEVTTLGQSLNTWVDGFLKTKPFDSYESLKS